MSEKHARIVTRMVLALDRLATGSLRPSKARAAREAVLIARVVFVAPGPLAVSAIARQTDLSRATVLRRLRELMKAGTVLRVGRRYCIDWEGTKRAYPPKRVRQAVALIKEAASELANLPEII